MNREEVYNVIDSERTYQEQRWNEGTTTSHGLHTFEEWIVYMEDYLAEAKHILSRNNKDYADPIASDIMRKVTAMGVACLEQHGARRR